MSPAHRVKQIIKNLTHWKQNTLWIHFDSIFHNLFISQN